MDTGVLVAALSMVTLLAVLAFALRSKKAVEDRMEEDSTKSTLAADKSSTGKPADV